MKESSVCIIQSGAHNYPSVSSLFRPSEHYPEYPFTEKSNETNPVYAAVRQAFSRMKLDEPHLHRPEWNPLGDYIAPGMIVLVKPNLVMHYNKNKHGGTDCLYTHPSVVAPVLDYVCIALKGYGRIIVGDAPMQGCDFKALISQSGYGKLIQYYQEKGIEIELVDFRETRSRVKNGLLYSEDDKSVEGRIVNLGVDSEFYGMSSETCERMRVTGYHPQAPARHHSGERHEYDVSSYVLDADVIINMPKPKTHRKAGVTISMKNLVGINTRKDYLPHHLLGSVREGGDEYDKQSIIQSIRSSFSDRRNKCLDRKQYIKAGIYQNLIRLGTLLLFATGNKYTEGSWHGNRTISKTIVDLNKIVQYCDKCGKMKSERQRTMLIVADMIISGEKEGPILPSPKIVGMVAAGTNAVCFDEAVCTLMGFDPCKIPTIHQARQSRGRFPLVDCKEPVSLISNIKALDGREIASLKKSELLQFEPTRGWKGFIEL